ncbi:unnamed protein product [Brachionus calyciflorus]|uniref:Laminin G domain-containing protein n=1 Tax=Brachionus calyciflorus TaxID=104777 RepID=A0A813M335_9BILA|nr:unnamed protein product [Brachionus calyciflorus]
MSSYRRTYSSDRFHHESVKETVQVIEPVRRPSITLIKAPSITSIVSINRESRPKSFRINSHANDNCINIKVEHDNGNCGSSVKTTYIYDNNSQKNQELDYKYKYSYNESSETYRKRSCSSSALKSKSMSNISKISSSSSSDSDNENSGVTFFYDNNDANRQVTYVKHSNNVNDSGLSLEGCLVKASPTFLPVTRSLQLGAIFNGSSFGLLTEHLSIKDSFNVSFDFKTTAKNGILMIVVDPSTQDSFFIELYDSQLKATLLIDGEPDSCWTEFPRPVLCNDNWANVNIQVIGTRMTMTVKNEYITKHHRHHLSYPIRGDLFIAGHPATIKPPFACRSREFFIGEMRNFFVNGEGVKWYGIPGSINPRLRNWY